MPVNCIPSGEQVELRQKSTARKRRRNQNDEIDELASLLPVKPASVSVSAKQPAIDKISVLRLSSSYLKFQQFLDLSYASVTKRAKTASLNQIFSDALDGFLLVLDNDANILFASESITNFVGLTQHDVIGQNLVELTHTDDEKVIKEKLEMREVKPLPSNNRQFYVRFKSTMSPGRMQLSRFTSHTMVEVRGNLRVRIPELAGLKSGEEPEVLGLIAECRLIESASVLEISIPQCTFTSTISLDMKILSVESSLREVTGYESGDFIGSTLQDFFHPSDLKSMVPCENLLLRTGHGVSPIFRFMAHTGDWVWMQLDGMVRYRKGTNQPQFLEVKAKVISQHEGKLKFIEQRELYGTDLDPHQDLLNPHRDLYFLEKLPKSGKPCEQSASPIVQSLKNIDLPESMIDSVLHARELGLESLPKKMKTVLTEKELEDYVVTRNARIFEGFYPELKPDSEAGISALKDSFSNLGYELPSDVKGGLTTENIMQHMEKVSRSVPTNGPTKPPVNGIMADFNGVPPNAPPLNAVPDGIPSMPFTGTANGFPDSAPLPPPPPLHPASVPTSTTNTVLPPPPLHPMPPTLANGFHDPLTPRFGPQNGSSSGSGSGVFDPSVYGSYVPENFNFESKEMLHNQLAAFNSQLMQQQQQTQSGIPGAANNRLSGIPNLLPSDRTLSSDSLLSGASSSKNSVTSTHSIGSPLSACPGNGGSMFSPDSGVLCNSVGYGGGAGGFSPQSVFSPQQQQSSVPSPDLQNGTRFDDSPDSGHPSPSPRDFPRSQPPSVPFQITDKSVPQHFIPQQQYSLHANVHVSPHNHAPPTNNPTNGIADADLQQMLCEAVTLNSDGPFMTEMEQTTSDPFGGTFPIGGGTFPNSNSQRSDIQELLQQWM